LTTRRDSAVAALRAVANRLDAQGTLVKACLARLRRIAPHEDKALLGFARRVVSSGLRWDKPARQAAVQIHGRVALRCAVSSAAVRA
jgi:hypothetical protein